MLNNIIQDLSATVSSTDDLVEWADRHAKPLGFGDGLIRHINTMLTMKGFGAGGYEMGTMTPTVTLDDGVTYDTVMLIFKSEEHDGKFAITLVIDGEGKFFIGAPVSDEQLALVEKMAVEIDALRGSLPHDQSSALH